MVLAAVLAVSTVVVIPGKGLFSLKQGHIENTRNPVYVDTKQDTEAEPAHRYK